MSAPDQSVDRADRREFLVRTAAAVASGMFWLGSPARADDPPTPAEPLPTIALGGHRITRLVAGSNPISGYSYLGAEVDAEMRDYFTPERTAAFLLECVRAGINAHQFSSTAMTTGAYRLLDESARELQLISLLSNPEDIRPTLEAARPIAVAHHGGVTDRLFREGRSGAVRDFVKAVHDAGLAAGVSAHNPQCLRQIADEGWDVDFFMASFYYITRPAAAEDDDGPQLDGPEVGYRFYRDDPLRMAAVLRQVDQPCLAFKILAGGRRCGSQEEVRAAFRFAFEQIKPTDAVIVGMYPRHYDQVTANAEYTRQLSAET